MSVYAWPLDSQNDLDPAYVGRSLRATTVAPFFAGAHTNRPLGVRSGVRPGTPAGTVSVTGSSWVVCPCAGVIDPHLSAAAGPYTWAVDEEVTGTIEAASAAYARWDGIYVVVDDPAEGDGSASPGARVTYVAGTPAPSPSMPPAPDRSLLLARIVVPATGAGTPSVVWLAPYLALAGTPYQVRSEAERNALFTLIGASAEAPLWVEHIGSGNPRAGTTERTTGLGWLAFTPSFAPVHTQFSTQKVAHATVLTSFALPASPVPTQVRFACWGTAGYDTAARALTVTWSTNAGAISATINQRTSAPAATWATYTSTGLMTLPADVVATVAVSAEADGPAYYRGMVEATRWATNL